MTHPPEATATTIAGSHTVVDIDPLFDDGPEAMIDLAHRFGRYEVYGEHEKVESDIGRGLSQRHDSVVHFLRTGGLRRADDDIATLAARTTYFREEYAYGDTEFVDGIGAFLHSERLAVAARTVHGRPVIAPSIAFANFMVPGQELAVHTDVPEFRGANRKVLPQWLLVVMHHSGLFEPWRLHIATGISWFHDSDHGELAYWPHGPDAPMARHRIRANTAMVLDTDTVFHGVDRVADDAAGLVPPVSVGSSLTPEGGSWILRRPDGTEAIRYGWDDLRFSVSWKAYCFTDEAERAAWQDHTDDLDEQRILDRLTHDLAERGIVRADVARDGELGRTLIDTYIRFPA